MKKILMVFFIFVTLLSSNIFAKEDFKVNIKNKNYNVVKAGVKVDGKNLNCKFSPYIKEGRTFVPIREITEELGAKVDWNSKNNSVNISLNDKNIKLQIGSSVVFVDNKKKTLDKNQVPDLTTYKNPKGSKTMVPLRFISETLGYDVDWDNENVEVKIESVKTSSLDLTRDDVEKISRNSKAGNYYQSNTEKKETQNIENKLNKDKLDDVYESAGIDLDKIDVDRKINKKLPVNGRIKLVIDPGHGGKDSGAIAIDENSYEKDFTLDVATRLYNKIESEGKIDVLITRTRDEYIALLDRAGQSNDNNADLFLSIHFNSAESSKPDGIEVLYASEKNIKIKDTVQKDFANELQKALIKSTGATNRGIKNRPALIVLNKTKTVAALAELGFLSNYDELDKIKDSDYIDKLVDGLYNGINNYIDKYTE